MRKIAFVSALALPLIAAACSSADTPQQAEGGGSAVSPAEVASEMAEMQRPRPGLYKSSMELVEFEIPGIPESQKAQMKTMFAQTQKGSEYCLTADEAQRGYEEALKKTSRGECSYDRFDVSGGTLDAEMTCKTGQGMDGRVTMQGTVSPAGSDMRMTITQNAPGMPGEAMKIVSTVKTEYVGECPEK